AYDLSYKIPKAPLNAPIRWFEMTAVQPPWKAALRKCGGPGRDARRFGSPQTKSLRSCTPARAIFSTRAIVFGRRVPGPRNLPPRDIPPNSVHSPHGFVAAVCHHCEGVITF